MPLFGETNDEKEERLRKAEERLAELEARRTELMHELLDIAAEQAERVRLIREGEKEMKGLLVGVPEHVVPEDRPLTDEDIRRWARSVFFQFAFTAPHNPHYYAKRENCDSAMYERVLRHVIANGYDSRYKGDVYRTYDLDDRFLWWLGTDPEESVLMNGKPISMRPGSEAGQGRMEA
jgi:hypothetical protein